MRPRRRSLSLAALALLVVTAGCSGGGGSTPTPTPEPTPVLTPPPTPTPTPTPTATPEPTPTSTEAFTPIGANITVAIESTVEWRGTLAYENASTDISETISGGGTGVIDVPDDVRTLRVSARKTEATPTPLVLEIQVSGRTLRKGTTTRSYATVTVEANFY